MLCDERLWQHQTAELPQTVVHADTTIGENFVDMAGAALESVSGRFAVAGLSMGGILAFEIWRQAPERVSHIALLDTNPYADTETRRSERLEQIEVALGGGLRELVVESLKPLYLAEAHRDDAALLDIILDMAVDLGPEVFRRQSLAVRNRPDSVATLATIDCPVLVLCGREDSLCPVAYHEFMAERIPHARLEIIDDCGHLSSLEQPQRVNDALTRLLSE